jgi:hypothetical protein
MTKASPARRSKRAAKKSANNGKTLNPQEQEQLVKMDRELAQQKIQLANIELRIADLERNKRSLLSDLRRGVEAFNDMAKEMAESHGIDPESTTESWRLDLQKMSFEKLTPQA